MTIDRFCGTCGGALDMVTVNFGTCPRCDGGEPFPQEERTAPVTIRLWNYGSPLLTTMAACGRVFDSVVPGTMFYGGQDEALVGARCFNVSAYWFEFRVRDVGWLNGRYIAHAGAEIVNSNHPAFTRGQS